MRVARGRALLRDLFPARSDDEPRRAELVAVAAGVVVLTAVALLRQTGVPATDSLWAEDGGFFLADAVDDPFTSTVLRPLGGYAHVAPRLLAEVASWLPLRWAAVVLSGGAALVAALVGAVTYLASAPHLRARPGRVVVAAAPVLLPIASYEVLNAAANLHFVLLYGAFWSLLWLPRRWPGRSVAAALVLLTTTSDPQSALLLPLAAARLVAISPVRARWRDHVPTAAYALGLAVQLAVVASTERGFGERAPADELARLYPLRVVSAIGGGRVVDPAWRVLGDWLTALTAVALVALVVVALRRAGRARVLVVVTAALSLAYWVGPLALRWSERMRPTTEVIGLHGSRYGLVPALLVLVLGMIAIDRLRRPRFVAALALAALIVVAAVGYRADNGRSDGPRWRGRVASATATCRDDPALHAVDVPIAPPPGWSARLPCSRLRAG